MMKPALTASTLRPATLVNSFRPNLTALLVQRSYATQQTGNNGATAKRRAVTPFNDNGRVPWTQLSAAEKTGRAAQQTFNFGFVMIGLVLTGGIGYVLYTEVFSPDSKTAYFNRAVDRIKKDDRCLELLGERKKIKAYGEETYNKWRRARPIASTTKKDAQGNDHLIMHFNVEGPRNRGTVNMHLVKYVGRGEYEYKYFFVDVNGQRIHLEHPDDASQKGGGKKGTKLFGIQWS